MTCRGIDTLPFVIVADLRTGSTLLSSSLNSHPRIRCYGELFHPEDLPDNQVSGRSRYALTGSELIRCALAMEAVKAAGFRAMVFLPMDSQPQWTDAWDYLCGLSGLRVIYLNRRDRLAQYASVMVATRTGSFHPNDDDPILKPENRPKVSIDRTAFTLWVQERDRLMEQRRRQLRGKPSLELEYEALVADWSPLIKQVQEFLTVKPLELQQAKKKQEMRPLSEVIVDYDRFR